MPPKCEQTNGPKCVQTLNYKVDNDGMSITMQAKVDDLLAGMPTSAAVFVALGFSLDQTMVCGTFFQ